MSTAHRKNKSTAFTSEETEMDAYFDFNQDFASPSTFAPEHAEDAQTFAAPSHEYGLFKQQTGLPSGAVSNLAAFSNTTDSFGPSASPFAPLGSADFDMPMGYNSGFALETDFDLSGHMPSYNMFADEQQGNDSVDPSEINPLLRIPAPGAVARPWRGMHSQQAEQAKAQALAKQQRQQKQGQQLMQQKQHQQQQQQQQSMAQQNQSQQEAAGRSSTDPLVEERISSLLGQMRHGSNASSNWNDDEDTPEPADSSRATRSRKDEEDMDDDERLLASEEGKKLTSKERRQLRNKVSARAFRSRRKEYISQLEGEVAAKSNECNQLRSRNRQLMEQNEQLTQLTRKLLAHPAFNNFLDDMAKDPSILAPLPPKSLPSSHKQESAEARSDEMPQRTLPSNDMDIHMTTLPQRQTLGFQMLNLENDRWSNTNHSMHFQQPQVYSVFDLPQPSPLELISSSLSGKPVGDFTSCESLPASVKKYHPIIEEPQFVLAPEHLQPEILVQVKDAEIDDSEYILYAEAPTRFTASSTPPSTSLELVSQLPENLSTAKSSNRFTLSSTDFKDAEAMINDINRMFDSLNPTLARIKSLTDHLPHF